MEIIIILYVLLFGWALVMWRTNNNAKLLVSFQKAVLFGFSTATETFELENEIDEHFQVALGFIIVTVTWTYALED